MTMVPCAVCQTPVEVPLILSDHLVCRACLVTADPAVRLAEDLLGAFVTLIDAPPSSLGPGETVWAECPVCDWISPPAREAAPLQWSIDIDPHGQPLVTIEAVAQLAGQHFTSHIRQARDQNRPRWYHARSVHAELTEPAPLPDPVDYASLLKDLL